MNLVTWSANVKYSIQIYRNPKDGRPTSGTKMLKRPVTGTIREAGNAYDRSSKKASRGILIRDKFAIVEIKIFARLVLMKMSDYYWAFVNKTKKDRVIFMIIEMK